MILKALKIIPFLAGTMNAPVLDTPKKANNDSPINTTEQYLTINQGSITAYADYLDDNETLKRITRTYYISNPITSAYGNIDLKYFTEDYYTKNTHMSNNVVLLADNNESGKTNYHSIALQAIKIDQVTGYNKIDLEGMVSITPVAWASSYSNQTIKYKITTYVYIGLQGTEYYNYTQEDGSLGYLVDQLKKDYRANEVNNYQDQATGLDRASTFIAADQNLTNYTITSNTDSTYFVYVLYEWWKESNEQIPFYNTLWNNLVSATYSSFSASLYNNQTMFVSYKTYALNVVQEVVDVPTLMFTILTMPFSFYSQAFNLTLFPNTQYSFNVGTFLLGLIAVLMFVWIIKIMIGLIKK